MYICIIRFQLVGEAKMDESPYDRGRVAHSHFIALRFLEAAQQQGFQGLTSRAQNRSVGRHPSTVGADQSHI